MAQGRRRRRSVGDEVALHVRRRIFDGELRPGERVPQDEITSALGVSRIPVREAIIALEREGWVTIEPFRGAFVNALDAHSVRDNYALFGMVWGFAAKRAIEHGGDELVHRIEELVAAAAATDDPVAFDTVAGSFQATIVEGARSPNVRVVLRSLAAMVPGSFFTFVPAAMEIERRGFAAVLDAARRGDAKAAEDVLHTMMRGVGDEVAAVFEARGLFGAEPALSS
jgi:DNA-binding GntR family transcriptional regulator